MRCALALTSILALAGCGSMSQVVESKVAVTVPCEVAEPERPSMPLDDLDPSAPVDVQARYMRAEIELRDGYEDRLVTALRSCKAPLKARQP